MADRVDRDPLPVADILRRLNVFPTVISIILSVANHAISPVLFSGDLGDDLRPCDCGGTPFESGSARPDECRQKSGCRSTKSER